MKKILCVILCTAIICTLAACQKQQSEKSDASNAQSTDTAYELSEQVPQGSVVDGVMTDIAADDPILKKSNASWVDTCVLYEVNIRQYTEEGTFAAFEAHLPRLKEMGINTLWLMPIHPISETERKGTLGSYYAVSDYRTVNPEFGTMEDFKHLMTTAHEMGFKVMLDWVANHTGWDNTWITDHEDWYVKNDNGKIISPYDWTDTAKLNYDNYEMRAEMIDCMRFWIEDMGVDGFRCDHAIGVPASFWNAAVYKLKSINSEIMMLAEASASKPLTTYAFDSCYNDALYGQAMMIKGGVATSDIQKGMELNFNYVEGSFPMNYLDNHDKNSYEGSVIERFKDTYEPLLALSYLTPGIPLIYTSNEEGYDHEIEFFEKDTVAWDDQPQYAPLITALSKIKVDNAALASTNTDLGIIEADNSKIFAFSRTSGSNKVIYIANLYYDPVKSVGIDLGIENATCVLHYDGDDLNMQETSVSGSDFAKKDYQPYEFYILTVNE